MYAERASDLIEARKKKCTTSKDADQPRERVTMQEMHVEFMAKCGAPNRGLKSGSERQLSAANSQQTPKWKQIFDEFRAKCAAKKSKKE